MLSFSNLLLTISCIVNIGFCSHWRYGQISWKKVSGTNSVEFTAEIGWRTTFIGSNYFQFGDGSGISHTATECPLQTTPCPSDTSSQLFYERLSDTVDIAGQPATLIRYIYQHTYPAAGPYTYRLSSCCRIGGLIVGSNGNFILEGTVDMSNGNTGSPVSSISPILQFTLGVMNTFSLNPVDNDGESVTCRKATSSESGISQSNGFYSVDSNTCQVTIMESGNAGNKWAAQVIMETASGDLIPLDFIFEGIDQTFVPPECTVISTPDASGNFEATVGNPLVIDLKATDPDAGANSNVLVNVISIPAGATVDPTGTQPIDGNGLDIEFYWVPTATQLGSFSASVQIQDDNSLTALCVLPLFVSPDCDSAPVRCRVSGDPHFTTWDRSRHHYQGGGVDGAYYDFVTECLDDNNNPEDNLPFNIAAFQQICNGPYTCVFGVKVELDDGTVINYPRNGIPTDDTGADARGSGTFLFNGATVSYTVSSFYFDITWTTSSGEIATVQLSYKGTALNVRTCDQVLNQLCGLCGTYNNDPNDDFTDCVDGTVYDNTDAGKFRSMSAQVWQNTLDFGDSCCRDDLDINGVCPPGTDPGDTPQPDPICLDAALDICDEFYNEECSDCNGNAFLDYQEFIDDCVVDVCAAADNDLMGCEGIDCADSTWLETSIDKCNIDCDEDGDVGTGSPTEEPTNEPLPAP